MAPYPNSLLRISPETAAALAEELANRISRPVLAAEINANLLDKLESASDEISPEDVWALLRVVFKRGLFELLPIGEIPSVSYNLNGEFELEADPIGFGRDYPVKPLLKRLTQIAGFDVDFPLALPASVLASNSKWIEFYSNRGFDILTYKTVRSQPKDPHRWPNWIFLDDAPRLSGGDVATVVGLPAGDFPPTPEHVSMANSFGVPALDVVWWQDDIRKAKKVVRAGHQVLIVSVVATEPSDIQALLDDYVLTARLAVDAGADIIEANLSCPNTLHEHGLLYKIPELSRDIAAALKAALPTTPIFVKIGYLPKDELKEFVQAISPHVDGITAINTISAKVQTAKGEELFPDRPTAGVSGWAIQRAAREVAQNLVRLRESSANKFCILGVGGVLGRQDFFDHLNTGVDAVGCATGAFLNPFIGLDIRLDLEEEKRRPSAFEFGVKAVGQLLNEVVLHPLRGSFVKLDHKERRVGTWFPENQ